MRAYLDVALVESQVGGGGVSGNPLGRVTSVIQFDDVSAMVAPCLHTGSGEGSIEEQWIPPALLYRVRLDLALTLTMSYHKSLVPPVRSQIDTGVQSKQVFYRQSPLMGLDPLRGVCH